MEFRVCPRCETLNQRDAATCMECGKGLLGAATITAEQPTPDRWWQLNTGGAKLRAIGAIIGLAWVFSPLGPVNFVIQVAIALRDASTQFEPVAAIIALLQVTALSIPVFPSGLSGYVPALGEFLPGSMYIDFLPISMNIVVIGWVTYVALLAALLLAHRKILVRSIFFAFVILIIWNTAGCYPIIQRFPIY
jgi:hypothetical protein